MIVIDLLSFLGLNAALNCVQIPYYMLLLIFWYELFSCFSFVLLLVLLFTLMIAPSKSKVWQRADVHNTRTLKLKQLNEIHEFYHLHFMRFPLKKTVLYNAQIQVVKMKINSVWCWLQKDIWTNILLLFVMFVSVSICFSCLPQKCIFYSHYSLSSLLLCLRSFQHLKKITLLSLGLFWDFGDYKFLGECFCSKLWARSWCDI